MQNFRHFLVKRAGHRFCWPSTQTKTDSFNPQNAEDTHWNVLSEVSEVSEVCPQIWPQVKHFGTMGQNVLRSSTIFQTLRSSTITFKMLVLQQRIWHHHVSLVEASPVIPNFAQKFKMWPPVQCGVTGQIRSKLAILDIIRFGATSDKASTLVHI